MSCTSWCIGPAAEMDEEAASDTVVHAAPTQEVVHAAPKPIEAGERASEVRQQADRNSKRINDQGAHVEQGLDGETWYCGRVLGRAAIPGSNGQCGPRDGQSCESCLRCQSGHFGEVQHTQHTGEVQQEEPRSTPAPEGEAGGWGLALFILICSHLFVFTVAGTSQFTQTSHDATKMMTPCRVSS